MLERIFIVSMLFITAVMSYAVKWNTISLTAPHQHIDALGSYSTGGGSLFLRVMQGRLSFRFFAFVEKVLAGSGLTHGG